MFVDDGTFNESILCEMWTDSALMARLSIAVIPLSQSTGTHQ